MKLVKLFFAAAIAAVTLTGCEALGEAFANSLTFVFSGNTVYDGQTALLGVTYSNDVAWEIDSKSAEVVSIINKDEHGKNCVAKFKLPKQTEAKAVVVKVTDYDPNNSSVEKNVGEITVAPWRLEAYKKNGETFERVDSYCKYDYATGQTTVDVKNAGKGIYKIQMTGLNGDKWSAISPIFSLNLLKNPGHKVNWNGSGLSTASDVKAEDVYAKEIDLSAVVDNTSVEVYMGVERDFNNNDVKNPKNDKNYVVKKILFVVK